MNIRKDMSWKEKLDYIWTYYKGWFITPVVVILIIGLLFAMDGGEKKQIALNGMIINQFLETDVKEQMEADMLGVLGVDEETYQLYVDAGTSLDLEGQSGDTVTNLGKITAYIFGEELDFMIAEPEIIEHYRELNGIADAAGYLSKEQYEALDKGKMLYQDKSGVACGLLLEDTEFAKRYGIELNNPVLCLINNSPRKENSLQIIEWIYEF